MKKIRVASIIVTWNKRNAVDRLIEALHQLQLHEIELEIYVIDNASIDGTQHFLEQKYNTIQVLQTGENLGGSGGFSYGLAQVSSLDYDYLWLLDNDVCLDEMTLTELVQTLETHSEVGLVGSQIRKLQEPETIQEVGSFVDPVKAHLKIHFGNCPAHSVESILSKPYIQVDVCAAASVLVRRGVAQQIGGFENYFLHFDDVEWCLRAQQAGWIVAVNPRSRIWHDAPDCKGRAWISYYDERNICYCWQKHRPELVSKRILVSVPRLVYYAATGRYFLSAIALAGYQDFIENIQGKKPKPFDHIELSLAELLNLSLSVWVQPTIELDQPHQNPEVTSRGNSIDIAIVHYRLPALSIALFAQQVYCFTGSGCVLLDLHPVSLMTAVARTLGQLWRMYWQAYAIQNSARLVVSLPQKPLVSIIICTVDRPHVLERALNSVKQLNDSNFETIIVDASTTSATSQLVDCFSRHSQFAVKFQKVTTRNISFSRNVGVKLAAGQIVAFFDDDAVLPSDWINQLLTSYLRFGENCAAVGGTVRDLTRPGHPTQFQRGITNVLSETRSIRSRHATNYNHPNGFWFNGLMGTNASFRKDLLEKINGYDEFFDYFLDETDVCLRLIQAGYEVQYTDSVVDHYPAANHNRIDQKHLTCWYSLAKNTTYFALKHGFKRLPFPVLVIRLARILVYRCGLRILRLKLTHRLPMSTIVDYLQQAIAGVRVGWTSGLERYRSSAGSSVPQIDVSSL
ncbi:glycosyltransferase [Leptolyngbya sp. NIES-2104]|uniref:glycosyltransferase n=1 Tax=Leptolyngbya sp. NIES-2104 TaxID=1552121 RepID=UPI0006ECAF8D|nr:glycosyltransferase family 2 protein [Leptolyngbya sp. NIES-2104]GAP98475.1 glycosyl transferase, family 2 [Leptolyngbya sp. NIES-2104]